MRISILNPDPDSHQEHAGCKRVEPLPTESQARVVHRQRLAIIQSIALATVIIFTVLPPVQMPAEQAYPDSASYFAIANGQQNAAYYYYAGRILHPLTARFVSHVFGLSLPNGFRAVSCISLVVLFVAVTGNVGDTVLVPLLFMAVVIQAFRTYYLPDLFYAGMCALFFAAFRRNIWLGLPLIFLLHVTRESTIFLTLITAAVMFRRSTLFAATTIALGVAAMMVTSVLVARGVPNHHGMPTFAFDLLKIAYNTSANIFGVKLWTDTNGPTTGCDPVWTVAVHVGAIRRLGLCSFQWWRPFATVIALASAFGTLPLFVRRSRHEVLLRADLEIAYWYGLVNLAFAPLIGGTVARYTLYAWPVFWLCVGELLKSLPKREKFVVVSLSLAVSWVPELIGTMGAFLAELGLYYFARIAMVQSGASWHSK